MRRGVVFSVATLLLVLTVLTLASFYAAQSVRPDVGGRRARNAFANAASDIEDLLNMSVRAEGRGLAVFSDSFPLDGGASAIAAYGSFVGSTYRSAFNSVARLSLGEPKFFLEPTTIVYGYPSYDKKAVWIYDSAGEGRSVEELAFALTVNGNLVNVTEDTLPGDMRVSLNASFNNGGFARDYWLSRYGNSTVTLDMGGSKIMVKAGGNILGGFERNGSVSVVVEGSAKPSMETRIRLNESDVGVRTNFLLSVDGPVGRSDYVWLTQPVYQRG